MDLSILTQTLSEYSSKALERSDLIISALQPLAIVLAGAFALIEFETFNRQFSANGGTLTSKILFQHFWKYFLCFFMIVNAALIFDTLFSVGIAAVKTVDAVVPNENYEMAVKLGKVKGLMKPIFNMIGGTVEYVSKISLAIIVMMRNFYLYIFRGLSPLMMAFFMSDTTRPITINFLKKVGAVAFQAVLVLLVVRIFPALVTDDLLKADLSGPFKSARTAFIAIAKGIMFIIVLWGTERRAKELLNAM